MELGLTGDDAEKVLAAACALVVIVGLVIWRYSVQEPVEEEPISGIVDKS